MKLIDQIEEKRLGIQLAIDSKKSPLERNKLGQFATPPDLAEAILSYVKREFLPKDAKIRLLDPAIGSGSFYSAAMRVFDKKRISGAVGVEIDPDFAEAATNLWGGLGLTVYTQDFTDLKPPVRFNLLVSNPPYVRHHHIDQKEKVRLQGKLSKSLGIKLSGLAGLYCYFMLLADDWLETDGVSVWLVPSEFMTVNYGKAIRQYLAKNVTLLHIHRFCPTEVQFSDALVSSAVVIFKKTPPAADHKPRFTFGGDISSPAASSTVSLTKLSVSRKWGDFTKVSEITSPDSVTLGALFAVKRGIATGGNSFFLLSKERAAQLNVPANMQRHVLPSPRHLKQVIIEANGDGSPAIANDLVLIDSNEPLEVIKKKAPALAEYLSSEEAEKVRAGYLASRRYPWYCQEFREPCPFLCTYMGRGRNGEKPFRFIWNRSKAVVTNVYLMLYPKSELREAIRERPELEKMIFEALERIAPDNLIQEGRVYGGGLHKLEPSELKNIEASHIAELAGLSLVSQRQLMLSPVISS